MHLKKFTCKGTLRQVCMVYLSVAQQTPPTLYSIRVYSILIHTGKGGMGRVEQE
jgi:hypothetical protein